MMQMVLERQQLLRKQGKKGFTLVELIVVIVILGILAAIAAPALVGYIDKARTDGAATEAATVKTAVQTVISDGYGHGTLPTGPYTGATTVASLHYTPTDSADTTLGAAVKRLTGINVDNTAAGDGSIQDVQLTTTTGEIVSITYQATTGVKLQWTSTSKVWARV